MRANDGRTGRTSPSYGNLQHHYVGSACLTRLARASGRYDDRFGVDRRVLEARVLHAGTDDPVILVDLAKGRLRRKIPAPREALEGRVRRSHRLLVRAMLTHIEFLEAGIEHLSTEIEQLTALFFHRLNFWTRFPESTVAAPR